MASPDASKDITNGGGNVWDNSMAAHLQQRHNRFVYASAIVRFSRIYELTTIFIYKRLLHATHYCSTDGLYFRQKQNGAAGTTANATSSTSVTEREWTSNNNNDEWANAAADEEWANVSANIINPIGI